MDDVIFGSLSTDELRIRQIRAARSGITHLQQRSPRDPLPGQAVSIEMTVGPDHSFDRAWLYWTDDGSDPVGGHGQTSNGRAAFLQLVDTEWDTIAWGYVRRYRGEIPATSAGKVVRYRLSASNGQTEVFADEDAYYAYYVDNDPPPAWTQDAIIYQVFADRFYSSAPDFPLMEGKPSFKCNGNLNGITAKLDYLADLGINCLWLTPIFSSPSYHGYDATSFFDINPRLGTKEDFRRLIDESHGRGIRILLDFVPNHWSNQHPSFLEAQKDSDSPYLNWYTFEDWPNKYKNFFGVKTLPQINLRNPEARQHVLAAAKYWLEFGVDGFRVDYCIGPSPDFYADLRRVTRAVKPDCWTFGEAVTPPDSQITFYGGMDGSLDFMLLEAFRNTFAVQKWTARRFNDFLDRHMAYFPKEFTRPSFLDNHDMNRFLWKAGGDKRKLRLAALCQFTLQGAPIIYYGTETGLSQERDIHQKGFARHEECRLPMLWEPKQDADLLSYYDGLIRLRSGNPALRRGLHTPILADDTLLAYRRSDNIGSLVTVINLADQPATINLPISEQTLAYSTDLSVHAEKTREGVQVFLPALGGIVLK
jgi:cyclomaltodextrinase